MKIAVLSGKGGAGKTMVAVNLAVSAPAATYIDCDVEEPNGRLFLRPADIREEMVTTLLPSFDPAKCTGCKTCVQACLFHALIYIREKPQVFSEVCHSCGLCQMICPEKAISEIPKPVGKVEIGVHGSTRVVTGVLNPSEASGIPVIKAALKQASGPLTVIDCPPGSACSVMESIGEADFCLLVAEPTAFGFHNFKMVWELACLMKKPCGVVINKEEAPFGPLEAFCSEHQIPILLRLPFSAQYARIGAAGEILSEEDPSVREHFRKLLQEIGGPV